MASAVGEVDGGIMGAFGVSEHFGGDGEDGGKPYLWYGLAVLVILMIVMWLNKEGLCGGKDQNCACEGNETMVGMRFPQRDAEDALSKVSQGL